MLATSTKGGVQFMSWSMIVTLAISIAVFIVIIMMALGGMNVTSPVARYAGIGIACFLGIVVGQIIHRRYVAK
jgi:hypothetical protein